MSLHIYAPLYRPPTFFGAPAGWELVERPQVSGFEGRMDLPLSKHKFGVIAYTEPLTDEQVAVFQLKKLGTREVSTLLEGAKS